MYILDTDHLSLLGRADSSEAQRLRFRLAGFNTEERVTTIITFEEQMLGWMAHLARSRVLARQIEAYRRLKEFLDRYLKVTVLEFDEAAAVEFKRLQDLRLRVGTMDLKIAAIALAHSATVLTRNVKTSSLWPACASKIGHCRSVELEFDDHLVKESGKARVLSSPAKA